MPSDIGVFKNQSAGTDTGTTQFDRSPSGSGRASEEARDWNPWTRRDARALTYAPLTRWRDAATLATIPSSRSRNRRHSSTGGISSPEKDCGLGSVHHSVSVPAWGQQTGGTTPSIRPETLNKHSVIGHKCRKLDRVAVKSRPTDPRFRGGQAPLHTAPLSTVLGQLLPRLFWENTQHTV